MSITLSDSSLSGFSPREAQILKLAVSGYTNAGMANLLGITEATVSTYWNRIRSKVGLRSRSEILLSVYERRSPVCSQVADGEHLFGVAHLDTHETVMWVNAHWSKIFGGSESSWIGSSFENGSMHQQYLSAFACRLSSVHNGPSEGTIHGEIQVAHPSGSNSRVRLTGSHMRLLPHNRPGFVVCAELVDQELALPSELDPLLEPQLRFQVVLLDAGGLVRALADFTEDSGGLLIHDIEGKALWDGATTTADSSALRAAFNFAFERRQAISVDASFLPHGRDMTRALWSFTPLSAREAGLADVVCIIRPAWAPPKASPHTNGHAVVLR